jgi:hypothetical protein
MTWVNNLLVFESKRINFESSGAGRDNATSGTLQDWEGAGAALRFAPA